MLRLRAPHYRRLLVLLEEQVPEMDHAKSKYRSKNMITMKDDTEVYATNFKTLLMKLNEFKGKPIFCSRYSRMVVGGGYILSLYEEGDEIHPHDILEGIAPVTSEPVVDTIEDSEDSQEDVSVISLEVQEDEEKVQPDWEWVNSLPNDKDSKVALDKYAEDKFDIKLKRNKTLENMIIDFKAALES